MQQDYQAYNGFELLCSELDFSLEELLLRVSSDPQMVLDKLNALGTEAMVMPLQRDLFLKGSETPFITGGTDLRQHLFKIVQQMGHGVEFEMPPMITPTSEITAFLQEKIGASFNRLISRVVGSIKIGKVAEAYDRDRDLKLVAEHFGELASRFLSKPLILSNFLHLFTGNGPLDVIDNSTRTAFVAMAALKSHERFSTSGDSRRQLLEIGLAVLFQDVSCLIEEREHDEKDPSHPIRSAEIAREIGLPKICIAPIRHHHRSIDDEGAPILAHQAPTLFENLVAVTNAFTHCISTESFGLDVNQTFYVLSHYADRHYFAKDCLQALGRVCIGERKQLIISKAIYFIRQCPHDGRPFLWDVRTEVPNRFLCQDLGCQEITNEEVILYESVRFDGPTEAIEIPKGRYCKCGRITKLFNLWLLKMFQGVCRN